MKRFEGSKVVDPYEWNVISATCGYDLETSVKNRGEYAIGSSKASPHHPDNKVVTAGLYNLSVSEGKHPALDNQVIVRAEDPDNFIVGCLSHHSSDKLLAKITLVGHNIKFDLLYTMKTLEKELGKRAMFNVIGNTKVWDTMVVEYLLTGQQERMPSLNKLCTKHKLPLKDEMLKHYWDGGVDTEDIPQEILIPYLKRDVSNVTNIYLEQYKKAKEMGMIPLIHDQMEQLVAIAVMEYNGMHVDTDVFATDMKALLDEVTELEDKLLEINPNLNPNSSSQLHVVLYGGKQQVEEVTDVLDKDGNLCYFKSGIKKGLKKTTKVKVIRDVSPVLNKEVLDKLPEKNVSEDVLKEILGLSLTCSMYTWIPTYLSVLLKYRGLSKEYSTYYVGIGKLIWYHDDCVHGNLNMAVTSTGRLASSSPNLQNMPGYSDE